MDDLVWMNFKLPKKLKEYLNKCAHAHCMTMSEYLRLLIEREKGNRR